MKNKILITIMVISLLFITGCHNKNNDVKNNLSLKDNYLKEDLIGCYEKSAFVVYNEEEILTNAYYDNTLKINESNIEICYKDSGECVVMNYVYNNNIFSLDNKDTIFFDKYDVIYFNKNDEKHNLILRAKFDEYIKMYPYYRKVECQNED